jgi:hypothetical protein
MLQVVCYKVFLMLFSLNIFTESISNETLYSEGKKSYGRFTVFNLKVKLCSSDQILHLRIIANEAIYDTYNILGIEKDIILQQGCFLEDGLIDGPLQHYPLSQDNRNYGLV